MTAVEEGWEGSRTDVMPDFSLHGYQDQKEENLLGGKTNLPGFAGAGTAKTEDLLQSSCTQDWGNNQRDRNQIYTAAKQRQQSFQTSVFVNLTQGFNLG